MFYEKQSTQEQENYKKMLRIIGNLSFLFSESSSPYLPYRCHENIFCKYFGAENISRHDSSADAKKGSIGIGLKTFVGSNDQKVAEFGKKKSSYSDLCGLELVKKIAEYRNERINTTMRMNGIESMIYHVIKRVPNAMEIFEYAFECIDIKNIKLLPDKGGDNNTYFTDGKHTYHFSTSKNTLYMIFDDMTLLDSFEVDIMQDPYAYLMDLSEQKAQGENNLSTAVSHLNEICLRLYSTDKNGNKFVPEKSGLNQWNASGRERNEDEIYIPYPAEDRAKNTDFFPKKDTPFTLILPDGASTLAKVCQGAYKALTESEYNALSVEQKSIEDERRNTGKAIMSNPNKFLGNWLLRKVLRLEVGTIITYDMLETFDIDSVIFTYLGDNTYAIKFARCGTYEKFYGITDNNDESENL